MSAAHPNSTEFAALHDAYVDRVYRYVRLRVDSEEDAADLTQQAFLQALSALPKYDERGIPFGAWLFRIARNVVIDAHRRRRRTVAWELVDERIQPLDVHDTEEIIVQREAVATVRALLGSVDEEDREVVRLRFGAELTIKEIASATGSSESTVKRRLATILETLRGRYREE